MHRKSRLYGHFSSADGLQKTQKELKATESSAADNRQCRTSADRQVPDEPASVRETLSERSKAVGHYYDMLGRKLESLPAHAPYIHNGKKIVR